MLVLVTSLAARGAVAEEPAAMPAAPAPVQAGAVAPDLTPAYVMWGIGALSAGLSAVMYVQSRSTRKSADETFARSCPLGVNPLVPQCVTLAGADDQAAAERTSSLLLGASALVGLIGGTMAFVIESKRGGQKAGEADPATLRAWLSPTGGGVSGTF